MNRHLPRSVVVVGAGAVGLSCAWHLIRRGAEVTVIDRSLVGSGASWGNAGYLSPAMVVPLPEPRLLREGVRALTIRDSPLTLRLPPSRDTTAFLTAFARHATPRRWQQSLNSLNPLGQASLAAFDELVEAGVGIRCREAPVRVGFRGGESSAGLRDELDAVRAAGQQVEYQDAEPEAPFSSRITHMMVIKGQRYVDPGQVLAALADAITAAGGRIIEGAHVRGLGFGPRGLQVETWAGAAHTADAVVVATGSWLPELAPTVGLRVRVQAGRGYSCTVPTTEEVSTPLYLPGARVAITPYRNGVRLAGIMEITHHDAPFRMARLQAVRRSVEPLVDGMDWAGMHDPWVGPRPLTPDGLPVIGETALPGVHVAGGHGMWGMTLAPVTGRLLAEQIMSGDRLPQLEPFSPLRGTARSAAPRR